MFGSVRFRAPRIRRTTVDFITEKLRQVLETLISTGFELPIRFALISTNGVILAGHFEFSANGAAVDTRFVAEHFPQDNGMSLPINIMFTDNRGEATRVCIESRPGRESPVQ